VEATPPPDSTPKKLLFWENRGNETQRLEEELMTTRIREMEVLTELKELRLKVMELETQVKTESVNTECDNAFSYDGRCGRCLIKGNLLYKSRVFMIFSSSLKVAKIC
jgi:hypothetical protein